MINGISLHIGLNSVDPIHYKGWSGPLNACEADANDIQNIALSKGFIATYLLTQAATRQNVINKIKEAANQLNSGDIFLLSYSGHGSQARDLNGDEDDAEDETWCLYDGQLVDDELYALWGLFRSGVRILVLSDSCHSGTLNKARLLELASLEEKPKVYRAMPKDVAQRVYLGNKDFYDQILSDPNLKDSINKVQASVLLLSGCQDWELSLDGTFNGLFTAKLLRTWNNGSFIGNYRDFHQHIINMMPKDQQPNYDNTVGVKNPEFEQQNPFTI